MTDVKSLARGVFWLIVGVAIALIAALIVIGPVLAFPGAFGLVIVFAIIIWASWPEKKR